MVTSYLINHRRKVAALLFFTFLVDLLGVSVLWARTPGKSESILRSANANTDSSRKKIERMPNPFLSTAAKESGSLKAVAPERRGKPTTTRSVRREDLGGPGQPEMQAFQSVNSNNMVDLFTGDFSYNIPLLDAGGYPIGLSYRGGVSMDQESSWVGLGWNINPGSIVRNVRGLPDDFNGQDSITKELNTKKKWTAGVNVGFTSEIFGKDLKFLRNSDISLYYDNYTGPGFSFSPTPSLGVGAFTKGSKSFGPGDLSTNISFDSKSGFNINPTYSVLLENQEKKIATGGTIGLNYNSRGGLQDLQMNAGTRVGKAARDNAEKNKAVSGGFSLFSSSLSFTSPTFSPTITMPTSAVSFTFSLRAGGELFGWHPLGSIQGFYSQNFIAEKDRVQRMPAYGYLHLTKSANDQHALLDFNREKDIPYRNTVPNISIGFQTYDIFSVSGEGIGGTFRAYRGDVGVIHDHYVRTKSLSGNLGIDLGLIPNLAKGGADVRFTNAYTETKSWERNNVIKNNLKFLTSDSSFEAVYFRNPGEQTSNTAAYYASIGGDDVVRVKLTDDNFNPSATNILSKFNKLQPTGSVQLASPIMKTSRDRRSQVMSYLSAAEARQVGADTLIRSYPVNSFPLGNCATNFDTIKRVDGVIRKAHHISEVTILNPDGRRYIYGIPAYNLVQKDATFSVDQRDADVAKGLVAYNPSQDVSANNNEGKDGYFNLQTTPANAHSFLLTELLSPDYSDITGDGISDDDIGDAVKFNYTRMKWGTETAFKWRAPMDENMASYDEGLRTDVSDDKGHFSYGEKEIWYLNSIESKTMIATFTLATDSLRKDGFEVKGLHGGRSTSSTKKLLRLKEINLYSKADLKKLGVNARPIKTVHFAYSYRLCKGYPDRTDMSTGKLTLDSVWFSYNKVKRGKENPYVFKYNVGNPDYQYKAYDRWGNYKPSSDNPGSPGIPNDDYPYAVRTNANSNAAAWSLSEIQLPSGGKMQVEYEADDYAFVQNRRALQMFQVVGFAGMETETPTNSLYASVIQDHRFVFIDVPEAVTNEQDIRAKYLQDIGKLYFKLHVKMPSDGYGKGYEYIPVYADIKRVGKVAGYGEKRIWIELAESPEKGGPKRSPLATAALQFLRLNLPSKAYPGSDVGNESAFKAAIMAVLSIVPEITTLLSGGFGNAARLKGKSKEVMTTRSFVRLSCPTLFKPGGGQRVKQITIRDNWKKMTDRKESYYGQRYDYTTTRVINGKLQTISSGVASYEPMIGNEENPFRQPIEYQEKATLAPSNFLYSEEPYAESLFPAAGVGYSKVRVSSINRKNIKSAPGFEETQFYTAYDFPTITDMTLLDKDSHKKGIDKFKPFNVYSRKFITQSQGFKIELNDMHGKMRSTAVFSEADTVHPMTYSEQFYKSEKISAESYRLTNTVQTLDSPSGFINTDGVIGKDIELIADMREQFSSTKGAEIGYNADKFIIPLPFIGVIIVPVIIRGVKIEDSRYRSAGLLKVIQRYGIVDSVVVIDKGSKVSTRNLLWDGETGDVLVSRTQNEFNDPIFQLNYPAHWAYEGMGSAYKNIDGILNHAYINGGRIVTSSRHRLDKDIVAEQFQPGDEVLVTNTPTFDPTKGGLQFPIKNRVTVVSNEKRLWVVDRARISGASSPQLFLIDRNGNEYTGHDVNLRIIRSGRRNMAGTPVGTITSLRTPIFVSDIGTYKFSMLKIDSTIGVIAAGAAVMKDDWPVEDRFKQVRYCDSTNKVDSFTFYPVASGVIRKEIYSYERYSSVLTNSTFLNEPFFTASRQFTNIVGGHFSSESNDRITRGIMQFDISRIPSYALVDSALLTLNAKRPRYLWSNFRYWPDVSKAHTKFVNQSELLQLTQPWNISTTIEGSDLLTTQTGKVTLAASTDTCQNYNVGLKAMAQNMVANPTSNYGILMRLTNPNLYEIYQDSNMHINHMSFCTSSSYLNRDSVAGPTDCANCNTASLYIKYHYRKDTCYNVCQSIFKARINPFVQGLWGNWRSLRSYVYYDRRQQSDPTVATNIRTDGEIKAFAPFWIAVSGVIIPTADTTRWVWNSEITRYNRRGLETENHDPLGRFNSGLYGYSVTLPIAIAQNSRYREMTYDGFEDYGFALDGCNVPCPTPRHFDFTAYKDSIVTTVRHTGKASLRLGAGSFAIGKAKVDTLSDGLSPVFDYPVKGLGGIISDSIKVIANATYPLFTPRPGRQMVLGAWVKEDKDCNCLSFTGNSIDILFYQGGSLLNTVTKSPAGAIIEGWQRYDEVFDIPSNADSMVVKLKNNTNVPVYFDDLRLHPYNSNMKSFVYHPTNLRLLAELDENNYASFYEYDDEGTLIRVKKETERGVKTIKETRSSLQKVEQ